MALASLFLGLLAAPDPRPLPETPGLWVVFTGGRARRSSASSVCRDTRVPARRALPCPQLPPPLPPRPRRGTSCLLRSPAQDSLGSCLTDFVAHLRVHLPPCCDAGPERAGRGSSSRPVGEPHVAWSPLGPQEAGTWPAGLSGAASSAPAGRVTSLPLCGRALLGDCWTRRRPPESRTLFEAPGGSCREVHTLRRSCSCWRGLGTATLLLWV